MRKSQNRLLKDQNNILSDVFLEVCRGGKTNTLVRRRKMPLVQYLFNSSTIFKICATMSL